MKITFVNKVENSGSTNDGKVFAVNMNEIKSVVNTNEDLRVGQTITSGVYSSTLQSLVFKNALNATILSISLADLVTGGGGIADAPADNSYYARRNNIWIEFTPGITDAPNNTNVYGRSGGSWVVISSGIADAPSDNSYYARRNGAWVAFTSGITDAPNNSLIYARSGGNWVTFSVGIADAPSDSYTYARKNGAWVQISTGGSGGVTVHNDLTGRGEASCHPISAITDLQTTLTNINTAIGGKANLAGDATQNFSAKVLTVASSLVLNNRTLTIRTL